MSMQTEGNAAYIARLRARRAELGLCWECNGKRLPNRTRCVKHARRRRKS